MRDAALATFACIRGSISASATLQPADALEALVRTLEFEHELLSSGALNIGCCDLVDDAQQARDVRRELVSVLNLIEERCPGTEHRLQSWNDAARHGLTLQSYLAHERLLALTAAPDEQHKAKGLGRATAAGAFVVAALLLWGWMPAAIAAVIAVVVIFLLALRPAPLSQAQRFMISERWACILPAGLLTAEKLQRERDALAAALVQYGTNLTAVEDELVLLNQTRREQADTGAVYHRHNSSIILRYTGPFEIPHFS